MRPGAPPTQQPAALQTVVALVLLAAAVALCSTVLRLDEPARAASAVETRVAGVVVPGDREARAVALGLARPFLRTGLTLQAGPRRYTLTRAALGVRVDLEALSGLLGAARDAGSPLRRLHAQQRGDAPLSLPLPARLEGDAARRWLESLVEELAEPALAARVDPRTGVVIAPEHGRMLDVEGTLDALAEAVYRGRGVAQARFIARPAPAAAIAPRSTIDIGSVLGQAESAMLDHDVAWAHNLRVAARSLDGTLIAPGEQLDVRAKLAEPLATLRFHPGPVAAGTPDALEAAVAQVMRTLHMALIDADMALLEEPFVPEAEGALPNLRLESGLTQPCAIMLEVRDGRLHAEVRGAQAEVPDEAHGTP